MIVHRQGQYPLPRELVDAIIDKVWNDRDSLVSCSLVHPTWAPRAQYHIFREISIPLLPPLRQDDPSNWGLTRLANSLQTRPALASLVHCLSIQGYDGGTPLKGDQYIESRSALLVAIIPLIKRVRTVLLEDFVDAYDISWQRLPLALQGSIFDLLFQPSVNSIHILAVEGIPVMPFAQCGYFEHLEVGFSSFDTSELDAPFPMNSSHGIGRRPLYSLKLNNNDDMELLRYLLADDSFVDLSALQELHLAAYDQWESPRAQSDFLKLMKLCSGSLQMYQVQQGGDLDFETPQPFPKCLLQLNLIPRLRHLSFELNWYFLEEIPEQRDVIGEIADALKLLDVPGNVLERFEITLEFDHPIDSNMRMIYRTILAQRFFEQWAAVDAILSSSNFYAEEESVVRARVFLDYDQVRFGEPVPESPKAALQLLAGFKTLEVYRLPTVWNAVGKCLVWDAEGERDLLSGEGVEDYRKDLQLELGCTCGDCI